MVIRRICHLITDEERRYKIALAETYDILKFTDTVILNKIPKSFIDFLKKSRDLNYISNVNPYIPLKEQDLLKETEEILALIYRDYIAMQEEKEKLLQKDKEEQKKHEEKILNYSYDELFKKRNQNNIKLNDENEVRNSLTVIEQTSGIKKVIMKIKKVLSKLLKTKT